MGQGPGQGPVKITITDASGNQVNILHGPGKQGFNRVVWRMDYEGPPRLNFLPGPSQEEENPFFNRNAGPGVAPGTYKVTVAVNGQSQSQTAEVEADPRFHVDKAVFEAQTRAALEARDEISTLNRALNRMESIHAQVGALEKLLRASGESNETGEEAVPVSFRPVLEQARSLDRKLRKLETDIYNTDVQPAGEDSIHYLARFHDRLTGLMRSVNWAYDQPPNQLALDEMAEVRKELETHLQALNDFLKTDVTAFNKLALEKGANTLFAGDVIELKGGAARAGGGQ